MAIDRETREVRTQIARQRRRMERRLRAARAGLFDMRTWSERAAQHPGTLLLSAFGGGFAAGAARGDGWLRFLQVFRLGRRLWTVLRGAEGANHD